MQKIEFILTEKKDLIKAIIDKLPFLSRFDIKKILEQKDIRVNNIKVKESKVLEPGDEVTVFYKEKESADWYSLVYLDDSVIIVNKRAGIEVVSDSDRDLVSVLRQTYDIVYPVHRIDRNTEGLVIFARTHEAEKALNDAFKLRKGIDKRYALLVHGRVDITKIKRTMYLKKVENLSKVWISELKTSGYDPIVTEFNVIQYMNENTLMEAKLITGKTHQIRAHIAYFGHPIVGDNKYGKDQEKMLHLTANYLAFSFDKKSVLYYLNKLNFEITPTWLNSSKS